MRRKKNSKSDKVVCDGNGYLLSAWDYSNRDVAAGRGALFAC
jgi:hypothetical protein